MHHRYAHSENVAFTVSELCDFIDFKLRGIMSGAIERARKTRLIDVAYDDGNDELFSISREGIEEVDSWSDQDWESVAQGINFITDDDPLSREVGGHLPASDRTVTLNHNQSDYQQAVEALDKVLEEFRNDHRLDNELGPLKEAHLKVLEGGRKALEDEEISVENGQNWIVAPLKWIAEKFADGALKVLAVKALEAIAKLF